MIQLILFKLGLLEKYTIIYNGMICNSPDQKIDFYYFKRCPEWLLKEKSLEFLRGKIQTCVSNVVCIISIGDNQYDEQFVY